MVLPRWFIPLCLTALACTPKLNGTCASNSDCHPGESCSAAGLCLLPGADTGNGNGDAGGAGASIEIIAPTPGAVEKGSFHVAAQTASAAAIQDVTFYLTNASSGVAVGQQVVAAPSGNIWADALTLNATAFGGSADLVAVMHRAGLTDVTSAKVTILVDQNAPSISPSWNASQWWALDAGITVVAAATDDRSGVVSASLILPDGGTASGALTPTTATFTLPASAVGAPGAAVTVPVSLGATDLAGNSTLRPDASTLSVDDQPPSIALVTLDSSVWRNGLLDVNAGVGDGTGSGLAGTSLLLNGAFTSGTPDGGGGFNYHVDLSALPATEAPVGFQVVGVDNVGNQADAGFSLNVDNIAPVISAALIDTAFDGMSSTGGWFAGPTAAPSATAIALSAAVKDTNLVVTGIHRPAAIINGTSYYGLFNAGTNRWGFSIPRSVGLNASAPVAVSFDAQDLAGNHPASPPSLSLQFDDVPAASFTPLIGVDTGWYARTGNLPVGVTFGTAPRSGFASVQIQVSGQLNVSCTSFSALSWSCSLPLTYATAGAEGPFSFPVVAKSMTKISSSNSGIRYLDDVNPVIAASNAISYPTGSWGHDGSHYTLRDSGILYTFSAYDCGAGVNSTPVSFGFTPQLVIRSASITNSGTAHACANGASATVFNVAVSGDLSTSTPGSFAGADNTSTIAVTIQDGVGHTAGSTVNVGVTRRLWQTGAIAATHLAMGPVLVVASDVGTITGLSAAIGTVAWGPVSNTANLSSGPAVGGSATAPLVYYGLNTTSGKASVYSLAGGSGAGGVSCNASAAVFGNCPGSAYSRDIQLLSLASDGTAAVIEDDEHTGITAAGADCGTEAYTGTHVGAGCSSWFPSVVGATGLAVSGASATGAAIGRGGQAFIADRGVAKEIPVAGGSFTAGPANSCLGRAMVTDNGGNDSPVCDGQRTTWSSGFTLNWSTTFTRALQSGGFLVVATSGGAQPLTLSSGSPSGAGLTSQTAWAIDASSPSVVYLSNGATLSAQHFSSGSFGSAAWGLPAVPGTSISDVVMDKSGILYVASGGQVSAIITDSPGLGTGSNGWPIAGHDACRSYNLEYSCPW